MKSSFVPGIQTPSPLSLLPLGLAQASSQANQQLNQQIQEESKQRGQDFTDALVQQMIQSEEKKSDDDEEIKSDQEVDEETSLLNRIQEQFGDEEPSPEEQEQIIQQVAQEIGVDPVLLYREVQQNLANQQNVQQQVAQVLNRDGRQYVPSFIGRVANLVVNNAITIDMLTSSGDLINRVYTGFIKKSIDKNDTKIIGQYDQLSNDKKDTEKTQQEIIDIIQRPTAPHCKRHIWTDQNGKLRTLLVCSDEFSTRSYFDQ